MSNVTSENLNQFNSSPRDLKMKMHSDQSKIESFAHQASEKISDSAAKIIKGSSNAISEGRGYIKENPLKSVAAATTVGIVVGGIGTAILKRKKHV